MEPSPPIPSSIYSMTTRLRVLDPCCWLVKTDDTSCLWDVQIRDANGFCDVSSYDTDSWWTSRTTWFGDLGDQFQFWNDVRVDCLEGYEEYGELCKVGRLGTVREWREESFRWFEREGERGEEGEEDKDADKATVRSSTS